MPGSLLVAHSQSLSTATTMQATAKMEVPTTPPQEMMLLQSTSNHKPPCALPGFKEIAQAQWGRTHGKWPAISHHQCSIQGTHRPTWGDGVSHDSDPAALIPHHRGIIHQHKSCALRIVGLGLDPMADDHPALTLQELSTSLLGAHLPISMMVNAFIQHVCHDASISHLSHTTVH